MYISLVNLQTKKVLHQTEKNVHGIITINIIKAKRLI